MKDAGTKNKPPRDETTIKREGWRMVALNHLEKPEKLMIMAFYFING
jgi:hypothetical protein